MGDVGDFWRDFHDARRAAGLPTRCKARQAAASPTKRELLLFAEHGFEQKSEWHWQRSLAGEPLDWWPSKSKWMFRNVVTVGPWKDLVDLILRTDDSKP